MTDHSPLRRAGPACPARIRIATVLGASPRRRAGAAVYQFAATASGRRPVGTVRHLADLALPAQRTLGHGAGRRATAVLSAALGLLLALGRLSRRPLGWLAGAYVEIFRTVPALLLIYVTLFALPQYGLNFPLFWKLVVPLVVSNSAAFAEIFRAGIRSLDRGQSEAGLAIGLRRARRCAGGAAAGAAQRCPSLVSQLGRAAQGHLARLRGQLHRAAVQRQVLASYTAC